MGKNFKKISFVVLLSLIIMMIAPFNTTETLAASAPTWSNIKSSKKTLYVGKTYDLNIKNKPKTKVIYKWYSSDNNVVSIAKGGIVTAKKVGTAIIKCSIMNKKTLKTVKTLKATFTIKESANKISIANPTTTVEVGNNVYDFNVMVSTQSGNQTTDKIYWIISGDSAGTSVDTNGVVTTTKVGEFKLQVVTATSDNNFKTGKYTAQSDIITVKVPVGVKSVKQSADQKVEVTFNTSVNDIVKQSDFAITNANTYAVQPIKSISFSNNGKTVILETYISFINSNTYKLSYGGRDYNFTSVSGEISSIVVKSDKVVCGVPTEVQYTLYDSNGIDVTASKKNLSNIDIQLVDSSNGYIDGKGKVVLYKKGDTARVRVTYHMNKYVNGVETVVVGEGIITAVDQAEIIVGNYEKYTIAKSTPNWNSLSTTNNTISVTDSTGYKIYVLAKDSTNKYISESDIKYSSTDNDILLVAPNGDLCPIKEGKAYVIATVGKTSWTLPITVTAERRGTIISIDKPSINISNSRTANEKVTVKVSIKDQYGNDYRADAIRIEGVVEANSKIGAPSFSINESNIIFNGTGATKGDYVFIITAEGKKIQVYVKVVEPVTTEMPIYNVELSQNYVDTTISDYVNFTDKKIAIKVGEYRGGVLNNYIPIKSLVITKPDNTELKPTVSSTSYDFETMSASSGVVKKVQAGTYKIVVTIVDGNGKDISIQSSFMVKESQTAPYVDIHSLATYKNTIRAAINDCITIKDSSGKELGLYDIVGATYKSTVTINNIDSTVVSGTPVHIDRVTVNIKVGNYIVQQEIAIDKTILFQ